MPEEITGQQPPQEPQAEDLSPDELGAEVTVEIPEGDVSPQQPADEAQPKKNSYQERINELTKARREAERKTAALEREIETLKTRVYQAPQQPQQTFDPNQALNQLKAQKREALKELDFVKADEIQDTINAYTEQVKEYRLINQIQGVTVRQTAEQAIKRFQDETDWYNPLSENRNDDMALYAEALAQRIGPAWQQQGKTNEQILTEIRSRTEQVFGYKKAQPTGKTPVSFVQGPQAQIPGKTRTVTLTAEERTIARKMFPGDPDAEKKYATGKAEGGANG